MKTTTAQTKSKHVFALFVFVEVNIHYKINNITSLSNFHKLKKGFR